MNTRSFAILAASLVALAACDQPKFREAPKTDAAAPAAPAAAPAAPAQKTSADPLPALPEWAKAYIGRGLRDVLPEDGQCDGNTDAVEMRYNGSAPGTKIIGWGWNITDKKAVERVVLVDRDFKVVGAGETGLSRPDVPSAKPQITSQTTGWSAVTPMAAGAVDTYGITNGGRGVCKLGHLDF